MGVPARERLKQAIEQHSRGNFEAAKAAYRGALDEDADNPEALNGLGVVYLQQGSVDAGLGHVRRAVLEAAEPKQDHKGNLAKALILKATQEAEAGRFDTAIDALHEAAASAGDDAALLDEVLPNLYSAGLKATGTDWGVALEAFRLACRLRPDHPDYRNALDHALYHTGRAAEPRDYGVDAEAGAGGRHLFVCCFPKSGSTFLSTLLGRATGFPQQHMTYGYLQNEEELYLPYVRESWAKDTVTQLHCRATEPNVHVMQAFGIRPVVLVRNIFDTLLSYKEFYDHGAHKNTFFRKYPALDDETRMDLIVDDRGPWYLAFYASWHHAIEAGLIDAMWLSYEDMRADTRAALDAVLAFYGVRLAPERRDAAIAQVNENKNATRFNKGLVGRGAEAFSARHREHLARLTRYYPDVDFSRIGL